MNRKLISLLTFILILGSCSHPGFKGEEGQYLAGTIRDKDFESDRFKNVKEESYSISGAGGTTKNLINELDGDGKSYMLSGTQNDESPKNESDEEKAKISETGQRVMGTTGDNKVFLEHDIKALSKNIYKEASDSLSVAFFKDTFDYKNKNSNFDDVYRNEKHGDFPVMMVTSIDHFLYKGWIDLALGGNVGVGYNGGPGYFTRSKTTEDDVHFTLWSLPVDLALTLELHVKSWLKLGASAGPSALGLIQVRSDREYGDDQKERRQIGYGYFAAARAKFGLGSNWELFSGSEITSMYLNVEVRQVSYSNFRNKDVEISGQSIGVGFSFEYL